MRQILRAHAYLGWSWTTLAVLVGLLGSLGWEELGLDARWAVLWMSSWSPRWKGSPNSALMWLGNSCSSGLPSDSVQSKSLIIVISPVTYVTVQKSEDLGGRAHCCKLCDLDQIHFLLYWVLELDSGKATCALWLSWFQSSVEMVPLKFTFSLHIKLYTGMFKKILNHKCNKII